MKTYKKIWDNFISVENFELAAKKAVKSKKSKSAVKKFLKNKDVLLQELRNKLLAGKYKTSAYNSFTIYEPKQRVIYNLPLYPDHIVHHALINVLGPIWQAMFVRDSYACIPGRGLHTASQKTMQFVRRNKYVLQCDIRKFYPSIDHTVMMEIIARKIHDRRILNVLHDIVWSIGGDKNIPIGNLTSQWLGNVYMNELDHFVKDQLHWPDYIRYCDDFCLYGNDKQELRNAAIAIEKFLQTKLKLQFSKSEIRRTQDGVTFIGYRHFKKFVLLRTVTAKKIKRRLMNIVNHCDYTDLAQGQLAAAKGWAKWACSYNFRKFIIKYAKRKGKKMYRMFRHYLRYI